MEYEKYTKSSYFISGLLKREVTYLRMLSGYHDKNYREFSIQKKKGERIIESPKENLKRIQKEILKKILVRFFYPSQHSQAYLKKKSIKTNAELHIGKKIILKIDLKNFFPSINRDRVYRIFKRQFDKQASTYLTDLCIYKNHLPQGAPTSPFISNLICGRMDKRLDCLASLNGLSYSRYADDIVFSGDKIKKSFFKLVGKIIHEEDFIINEDKTYWVTQKRPQIVTGLIVNDKVSFGKKKYKQLSAIIHNCYKTQDILEQREIAIKKGYKISNMKNFLYGNVSFLNSIDKDKAVKLKQKLDQINWEAFDVSEREMEKKNLHLSFISVTHKINNRFLNLDKKFLEERFDLVTAILNDCKIKDDFTLFCTKFARWINEIKISFLDKEKKEGRTLERLENWLSSKGMRDSKKILSVMRDIVKLADHLERHKDDEGEVVKIFKKHYQKISKPNYSLFRDSLLRQLVYSLTKIDAIIEENLEI
jgi:hypothetical protein